MIFSVSKQGYFIELIEPSNYPFVDQNVFGGEHHIIGAICPNCHQPLLRLFSINLSTILPNSPIQIVHCLFCWRCGIAQDIFSYQMSDNQIKILHYRLGASEPDFPYCNYPAFFPQRNLYFVRISEQSQKIICDVNSQQVDFWLASQHNSQLIRPQHQLGGEPYFVNSPYQLICPLCNSAMPFLLSVSDHSGTHAGFTGNEYVQMIFHLCNPCQVISAYQMCD